MISGFYINHQVTIPEMGLFCLYCFTFFYQVFLLRWQELLSHLQELCMVCVKPLSILLFKLIYILLLMLYNQCHLISRRGQNRKTKDGYYGSVITMSTILLHTVYGGSILLIYMKCLEPKCHFVLFYEYGEK